LGLEAEGKKEELVRQIGTSVRQVGMETYFSGFDVDSLHDICEDMKLKNTNSTNNKRRLVECIVHKQDAKKQEPPKKKQKLSFSKQKKEIAKGITYDDIFQHYYVDEVRDWCRSSGLKSTGKKSALIKRILAFLDGDTETTKAAPRNKKGKGKAKSKGKSKDDQQESGKEEKNDKGEEKEKK